ncbi:MAG: helix-turn-helix domain-containing protein [Flavipsychrobacter sp.]
MGYTVRQLEKVAAIISKAEKDILDCTGMDCRLVLCRSDINTYTPTELLNVVAAALGEDPEKFKWISRKTDVVEMRRLGAYFMKKVFPLIKLTQIGEMFGQDHSTISNTIEQAENMLETNDAAFMANYKIVEFAVNEWVRLNSIINE